MPGADYGEILDLFLWTMETLTIANLYKLVMDRSDLPYELRRAKRLVRRLRKEKLLRSRGAKADAVTITAAGRRRAGEPDPRPAWNRRWDGSWRVVSFDLPETRRKDRVRLWHALREQRLGLLQRSVWVSPQDVTPVLIEIVEAEGVPECFCGFESRRLFFCTDSEIVQSAWDFEQINRRQSGYLQNTASVGKAVVQATSLGALVALARSERAAYLAAFSLDPLLPRPLWPAGYQGEPAYARHEHLRSLLRKRFQELATP